MKLPDEVVSVTADDPDSPFSTHLYSFEAINIPPAGMSVFSEDPSVLFQIYGTSRPLKSTFRERYFFGAFEHVCTMENYT